MPGRGSYGPGGKWIYSRAKKLRAKNPDMSEGASFAIATQQAHKVNKSPKGFRTPEGMATAKAKMTGPVKEYRKTAMWRSFANEMLKISMAPGDVVGQAAAGPGPLPGGGDAPSNPLTGGALSDTKGPQASAVPKGAVKSLGPAPASVVSPEKAGLPNAGVSAVGAPKPIEPGGGSTSGQTRAS